VSRCWRNCNSKALRISGPYPDRAPSTVPMVVPLGCSRSLFLQPVIRLYAVPFSAFTGEEEEEEGAASEVEVES
jgi:hypothetical protein